MQITWNNYFFEVVHAIAKRATCDRGQSGCIIVRDNQILVTGYVGAPPGFDHCDNVGHELETHIKIDNQSPTQSEIEQLVIDGKYSTHCIRTIHAEENAILQAARQGISLLNSTLYCTMTPCKSCAMKIIRVGITKVHAEFKYKLANITENILLKANIPLTHKNDMTLSYPNSKL